MKHTQAAKSYNNPDAEGWVTRGTIFNVGQEHVAGLPVITQQRAKDCVNAGLHAIYQDGDPVLQPSANDPIAARAAARRNVAEDSRRQTKVDPPPQKKQPDPAPAPAKQDPNPTQPRRASAPRRSQTGPAVESLKAGGPTGATPISASSSPVVPAQRASTGRRRGMKPGGKAKAPSDGSGSTTAGD